jgi:methylated-DNA-protein-cysteine methyltransferase-like protein
MEQLSEFSQRVYLEVSKIPKGNVSTYARIAEYSGSPKAARAVGNILHRNPFEGIVPCHRVVNSKGRLSNAFRFGGINIQKDLLEQEGVIVIDNVVNLDDYLY